MDSGLIAAAVLGVAAVADEVLAHVVIAVLELRAVNAHVAVQNERLKMNLYSLFRYREAYVNEVRRESLLEDVRVLAVYDNLNFSDRSLGMIPPRGTPSTGPRRT